jgi:hypothetical protein
VPTLVFTSGFDPFQLMINLATFSRAGHVAIGIGTNLLHAYEKGVVYEPRERWFTSKRQYLVHETEILPDVSCGIESCFSKLGQPYDVIGAFKLAILITLKRMWSPLRSLGPVSEASHTCASFVMLLDPSGERIAEWRDLRRDIVTPADLLQAAYGPSFRQVSQPTYETW